MTNNGMPIMTAKVSVLPESVDISLTDRRGDSVSLFGALPDDCRAQVAEDAWTIGLRALKNAHTQAQEAKDVGKALLQDVDRELESHLAEQQASMKRALSEYFDPPACGYTVPGDHRRSVRSCAAGIPYC
jgi:hypothetical protein